MLWGHAPKGHTHIIVDNRLGVFVSFANRRYEELQLLDVRFIAFYSL